MTTLSHSKRTLSVFTPNTNQTTQLGNQTVEPRANDRHGPKTGRFAPKNSGGGVDKSGGSGIIKKRPKSLKIGKKERTRLSHQIATDFPDLKPDGELHNYEISRMSFFFDGRLALRSMLKMSTGMPFLSMSCFCA